MPFKLVVAGEVFLPFPVVVPLVNGIRAIACVWLVANTVEVYLPPISLN